MQNPFKTGKACLAKIAIIKALHTLEHPDSDIYLRGIRYFQLEPSFGSKVDTATEIRCHSALALVEIGYYNALYELINLMVDPEEPVRVAAIRAIAYSGTSEAELLLRMFAKVAKDDFVVVSECLAGLTRLEPTRSRNFLADFLKANHVELREAAAFALAESHSQEAFEILKTYWDDNPVRSERKMLILPLAVLKLQESMIFLLDVVENEDELLAADTIKALKIYKHDDNIRSRLFEITSKRKSPVLSQMFEKFIVQ